MEEQVQQGGGATTRSRGRRRGPAGVGRCLRSSPHHTRDAGAPRPTSARRRKRLLELELGGATEEEDAPINTPINSPTPTSTHTHTCIPPTPTRTNSTSGRLGLLHLPLLPMEEVRSRAAVAVAGETLGDLAALVLEAPWDHTGCRPKGHRQ